MDWQYLLLAVVEGVTEYLPISSTGHIIIVSSFLGIADEPFVKDYTVMVQFGAILAVVVLYWRKLVQSLDIYKKLLVGFLPAAIIGLTIRHQIEALLGSVTVVAWALLLGGVALIWIEKKAKVTGSDKITDDITYRQAAVIGLVQCLAFIPGVSRSAATIVGGLLQGIERKQAAEFSFLLALPTLTGATLIKVMDVLPTINPQQVKILLLGNLISFVVGVIAVRSFVVYLSRYSLGKFAWYRIALGLAILAVIYSGYTFRFI